MKTQSAETEGAEPPKNRITRVLALAMFVSSLGFFQVGYNQSIITHPLALKESAKALNVSKLQDLENAETNEFLEFLMELTHFIFPFGGFIGALISGPLVDIIGRRDTMMLTNGLSIISSAVMGFTSTISDYEFIIFSRLFSGICAGIFSCIVPMYIGEISPTDLRGTTVVTPMLFLNFGAMMAFIMGNQKLLGTKKGYPGLVCLAIVPAVLSMFLLPLIPESPRYLLLQKEDDDKAVIALKKLRSPEDVEDEIQELFMEEIANKPEKNMNILKLLRFQALRYQVLTIVVLMAGQQLSGIHMGYIYIDKLNRAITRTYIFEVTAMTIVIVSILSLAVLIYIVDSVGRRLPLLIGYGITNIFSILLTVSLELEDNLSWMKYVTIVLLLFYLFGYELGPAAIPSLLMVELFLQSSRASAFVLGGSLQWLLNFFMTILTFNTQQDWGTYIFLIFWPVSTITFIFSIKAIPDTHRRSFITIKKMMSLYAARKIMVKSAKDDFKGRARRSSRKRSSARDRARSRRMSSLKY